MLIQIRCANSDFHWQRPPRRSEVNSDFELRDGPEARYLLPPYGDGRTVAPGSTIFNRAGLLQDDWGIGRACRHSVDRTADRIGAANMAWMACRVGLQRDRLRSDS